MVRFIIVRHGETEFNRLNKYQGQFDTPLSSLGVEQAKINAEHIAKNYRIDAIYSSDLSRAVKTAEPIARAFGVEINTTPAFRELDVGRWTLRSVKEIAEAEPELTRAYRERPGAFRFPDGENFEEACDRAMKKLNEIASISDSKTVLIVSHGGVIRTLLARWQGYPIADLHKVQFVPNTSITLVDYDGETAELLLIGDNSHLPKNISTD